MREDRIKDKPKDKRKETFVNIGSSSLLIIFLVLSLVTFAVLALSTAKSDHTLSRELADHKKEYYEASAEAENILSEVDRILEEQAQTAGGDKARYREQTEAALEGKIIGETALSVVTEDPETDADADADGEERRYVTYSVPVSERQALEVVLEITDPAKAETYYRIQAWKVVSTDTWEGDQSIELLPMGE